MPDQLRSRHPVRQVVGVVLVLAALAVLAALVWHALWQAPSGYVVEGPLCGSDGGRCWAPSPPETSRSAEFGGTALYVLVALVAGVLSGLLVSWLVRAELVALTGLLVGSAVAAVLMAWVGQSLGPADPESLLETVRVGRRLPDDLQVSGVTPYLAWPFGALLGMVATYLVLPRRSSTASGHFVPRRLDAR